MSEQRLTRPLHWNENIVCSGAVFCNRPADQESDHDAGQPQAVLVQPSGYGTDNWRQLDAVREMGIQTRVDVVLRPEVTHREIEDLHRAGARGVRFIPTQPGSLPLSELERFGDRLASHGWHIQLMLGPGHLMELAARPDRLLWGSDWPHVNHYGKMPNTTELFDQLLDWVPDQAVRTRILIDNPARLYGF